MVLTLYADGLEASGQTHIGDLTLRLTIYVGGDLKNIYKYSHRLVVICFGNNGKVLCNTQTARLWRLAVATAKDVQQENACTAYKDAA